LEARESGTRHSFVIGDWRVEPAAGRIVRAGVERRLRPQVMDLLVALSRRPGEIITKTELLDNVWSARFVSESALTTAIGELRDALEDQPKDPRFIQTIPKRGYRLVMDVIPLQAEAPASTAPAPTPEPAPEPAPEPPTPPILPIPAAVPTPAPAAAPHRRHVGAFVALAFGLIAAIASGLAWRKASPAAAPPSTSPRIEVPISRTTGEEPAGTIQMTAIAPDGRSLVYAVDSSAARPLMRRDLETRDVVPIAGTEGAASPFFSADGAWIGFWQDGMYRRAAVRGNHIEPIVSALESFGAAWRSNGDLVFSPTNFSGLLLLPAGEKTALELVDLDGANQELSARWPEALPDSRFVLFMVHRRPAPQIQAVDVSTGKRHVVIEGGTLARFAAPDRLIFSKERTLMTAPFDPRTARLTGPPVELARGLSYYRLNHLPQFTVSATGVLAYLTEPPRIDRELVLVNRSGGVMPLGAPARPYIHPRVSPDGRQLALWQEANDTADIWTYDLATKQLIERTAGGVSWRPIWSPDSTRLAYDGRPSGAVNVFTLMLSDGARPQPLMRRDRPQMAEDWLPDGKALVMSQVEPETGRDLYLVNVDTRETHPLANERGDEGGASVSPDGRWVAYVWGTLDAPAIYAISASETAAGAPPKRVRLAARGREVRWSRDGRELFYRDRGAMFSLPIHEANGTLAAGQPVELFRGDFDERPLPRANYDVMPDGRFLMLRRTETQPSQALILSLNWRDRRDPRESLASAR
jgi:DNA-binding winged helix-turn-helix (wHTH) protein